MIILRRAALAASAAFAVDDLLRASLIRTILLTALVTQALAQPFRSRFVNNLELCALAGALLASLLQRPLIESHGDRQVLAALLLAQVYVIGATSAAMALAMLFVKRKDLFAFLKIDKNRK